MTDLKHDPEFPYVVVNTSGEPCAKYNYRQGAEWLLEAWKGYGRVIDTTPKPKIPEDAEFIYYTSWSNSGAYARRIGHAKNNVWETSNPTSRVDEEDLLKRIGDAEVIVLVRKEES